MSASTATETETTHAATQWPADAQTEPATGPPPVLAGRRLADFVTIERDPVDFMVPGILRAGGKMTLTAPNKAGKSWWAAQFALCLASGNCEWLDMKFNTPRTVYIAQAELSPGMYRDRLWAMLMHPPEEVGLDLEAAKKNLIVWDDEALIPETRPSLGAEGKMQGAAFEQLARDIEAYQPDLLILDCMYVMAPGLDENVAMVMGQFMDSLSELAMRWGTAVLLIHHHGKDSTRGARGSSAFESWGDTAFSMTHNDGLDGETSPILKWSGKFRMRDGSGWPRCIVMDTARGGNWFMLSDETPRKGGTRPKATKAPLEQVAELVADHGPRGATRKVLVAEIASRFDCSKKLAYEKINTLIGQGKAEEDNGRILSY